MRLFLGRDLHFPVALEGALKLKEISYIHAEGYPTAEMKHGPIALVDGETPCVFVAPRGSLHAKTLSNLEEVKARNGLVITVGTEGDRVRRRTVRRLPAGPRCARGRPAAAGRRAAPVAGLPRRTPSRLRYRQAAQPGQERDRGMIASGRSGRARVQPAAKPPSPGRTRGPCARPRLGPVNLSGPPDNLRRVAGVNSVRI